MGVSSVLLGLMVFACLAQLTLFFQLLEPCLSIFAAHFESAFEGQISCTVSVAYPVANSRLLWDNTWFICAEKQDHSELLHPDRSSLVHFNHPPC
jgi:hypothetical protein